MRRTAVIGLILGALILAACGQKSGVHLASGRNGALVNPDTGEVIGGANYLLCDWHVRWLRFEQTLSPVNMHQP